MYRYMNERCDLFLSWFWSVFRYPQSALGVHVLTYQLCPVLLRGLAHMDTPWLQHV